MSIIQWNALAFEGDAVYSMYIRKHLIFQGMTKPNNHQAATRHCPAKAQANLIAMLEEELFDREKEVEIYKRSQHNSHTAQNADVVTHRRRRF